MTQRGNRRAPIFLADGDQLAYRRFLAEQLHRFSVEAWGYCFMPNHVHLILVPADGTGLARAVGEAHRRYATFINTRERWSGHLFQGRFASVVLDERHFLTASRYVALNPVRARLAKAAADWPWSSTRAHLSGQDDPLVRVAPLRSRIEDMAGFFASDFADDRSFQALRKAESSGRPLGDKAFIADLEARLTRRLVPPSRGPRGGQGQENYSNRPPDQRLVRDTE